ncbi:mutarotase [Persicitalea jodogahamensis]|uniref:Mutarotase n=2 Tax=Persicitalea jodogahamensis TaxID=402147 RepID=A0A8J3D4K7_9BACT|nr:mutarotase [Persicitalea jodogahamensis]
MYAGVSNNALLAMGGANFPGKPPWEGGQKVWYDDIYILEKGSKNWVKAPTKLPIRSGYGVSFSYQNEVIIIGGSNQSGHLDQVQGVVWNGQRILKSSYPSLPYPLANMGGALLGSTIVLFGGSNSADGAALKKCLILDLEAKVSGWQEVQAWPGRERRFPVSAVYKDACYMFSGETVDTNTKGETYRLILQDSYRLNLQKKQGTWQATWTKLTALPRGASAGGTTLPTLQDDRFLFWGGVDAVTAQYKVPEMHPGLTPTLLYYYPDKDSWEYPGDQQNYPSRVTLPVVHWQGKWLYVSGEIKPGVRTPTVVGVR